MCFFLCTLNDTSECCVHRYTERKDIYLRIKCSVNLSVIWKKRKGFNCILAAEALHVNLTVKIKRKTFIIRFWDSAVHLSLTLIGDFAVSAHLTLKNYSIKNTCLVQLHPHLLISILSSS